MIVALVLFVVSVAVFAAAYIIIDLLANRWAKLPHFRYNYVGGGWAVCGVVDYKKADVVKFPNGKKFKVVRETIVFSNNPEPAQTLPASQCFFSNSQEPVRRCFSGDLDHVPVDRFIFESWDYTVEHTNNLFVPFVSEGLIEYWEQAKLFIPPQNPTDFAKKKREENLKADWRRWFAHWAKKNDHLEHTFVLSGVASVLLFIVLAFFAAGQFEERSDKEAVYIHLTAPGSTVIQDIRTTVGERNKLLIRGEYPLIAKGRISEILPIGGGVAHVCITYGNPLNTECGAAALSLGWKVGDTAYIREADLKERDVNGSAHFQLDQRVITEGEAKALVATGKFKIVE
jgi:hypothetical protein